MCIPDYIFLTLIVYYAHDLENIIVKKMQTRLYFFTFKCLLCTHDWENIIVNKYVFQIIFLKF